MNNLKINFKKETFCLIKPIFLFTQLFLSTYKCFVKQNKEQGSNIFHNVSDPHTKMPNSRAIVTKNMWSVHKFYVIYCLEENPAVIVDGGVLILLNYRSWSFG